MERLPPDPRWPSSSANSVTFSLAPFRNSDSRALQNNGRPRFSVSIHRADHTGDYYHVLVGKTRLLRNDGLLQDWRLPQDWASSFMCIERPERMRNSDVKRNGPLKEKHIALSGHDTPEFPLTVHAGSWCRGVDVMYLRGIRIVGQL